MKIKTIFTILCASVLLVTACSKGTKEGANTPLVGTWESVSVYEKEISDGETYEHTDVHTSPQDKMTLTLNADGTGVVKSYEDNSFQTVPFNYSVAQNTITLVANADAFEPVAYTYSFVEKNLVLNSKEVSQSYQYEYRLTLRRIN